MTTCDKAAPTAQTFDRRNVFRCLVLGMGVPEIRSVLGAFARLVALSQWLETLEARDRLAAA